MGVWLVSPFSILWIGFILALAVASQIRFSLRTFFGILLLGAGVLMGLYRVTAIPLPADISVPQGSVVYDRDGKIIGTLSEVKRIIIDIDELPEFVMNAVLAAEDRDFYTHGGVSVTSIARASLTNLREGRIVQGGSTITQQYVKNAVLRDSSRTWVRKTKEAVLAVKLEDRYSKRQILNFYLNTIYFGRGVYGIEAAARAYFEKSAERLSLGQAAFLAGLIRSPESLEPAENPFAARSRRDEVLTAMGEEGFVSARRARAVSATPLRVARGIETRRSKARAVYFMEWIRRGVLREHFSDCLYRCGLQIHTTLDLDIQRYAERAVRAQLERRRDPEAALVAMTPGGRVLAMVGGRSSSRVAATGFNLAADYPGRQAGSTLKPFTLLAALQEGISPTSLLGGSSPRVVDDPACRTAGKRWRVNNYGGSFYGMVSLAAATAYSVNTAYAQLAALVGPDQIADVLARFGFNRSSSNTERTIEPLCSLSLGALDVTPLEMARAYAALASGGVLPPSSAVAYVADESGHCIKAFVPDPGGECDQIVAEEAKRVASPDAVATVTELLEGVVAYGTGSRVNLPVAVSAKTGTSQNNTDAWFAGYTEDLAATVWVGYPAASDGTVAQMRRCGDRTKCRPVNGADVTGGTIPADIWQSFMRKALAELAPPAAASGEPTQPDGNNAHQPLEPRRDEARTSARPDVDDAQANPPPPDASPPPDSNPAPLPIPLPTPTRTTTTAELDGGLEAAFPLLAVGALDASYLEVDPSSGFRRLYRKEDDRTRHGAVHSRRLCLAMSCPAGLTW